MKSIYLWFLNEGFLAYKSDPRSVKYPFASVCPADFLIDIKRRGDITLTVIMLNIG
jgi:hypothetical protein